MKNNPIWKDCTLRILCNPLTGTALNNDFLAIKCYTFSSNGIHLIILFSVFCLASGNPDGWVRPLPLACRSPVNLRSQNPGNILMAAEMSISSGNSPTFSHSGNFPQASHTTHQVLVCCCLLVLLHAGSSRHGPQEEQSGVIPIQTAWKTIYRVTVVRVFMGFYILHEAFSTCFHNIYWHVIWGSISEDLSVWNDSCRDEVPCGIQVNNFWACVDNCL